MFTYSILYTAREINVMKRKENIFLCKLKFFRGVISILFYFILFYLFFISLNNKFIRSSILNKAVLKT